MANSLHSMRLGTTLVGPHPLVMCPYKNEGVFCRRPPTSYTDLARDPLKNDMTINSMQGETLPNLPYVEDCIKSCTGILFCMLYVMLR